MSAAHWQQGRESVQVSTICLRPSRVRDGDMSNQPRSTKMLVDTNKVVSTREIKTLSGNMPEYNLSLPPNG